MPQLTAEAAMVGAFPETIRFEQFTIDVGRGCLRRGAEEAPLRPKSFAVLCLLARNPGRLICKSEFFATLWSGLAVTDDVLVQCICDIRRALHDDTQHLIKTVPRRGYLFDAAILRQEPRGAAEVDASRDTDTTLANPQSLAAGTVDPFDAVWDGRIVSESAITTRINAARRASGDDGASQRLTRTFNRKGVRFVREVTEISDEARHADEAPGPMLPADKPSLAVLPFRNMSGDPEQEYFADGIVEEITTAIARFSWLFVISRNSAFAYKGKAVDVRRVARELGVRYVLEGSVRKAANRVRITGQLIDGATGAHLWADRFDGRLDDIFELQDQVTSGVVGAIEPKLRLAEIERASHKPTQSLDAYDLYLRARAESRKRTRESHAAAIWLARQALECDPAYAPAMAQIASCRVYQLARGWLPTSGSEVEEGVAMARLAIAAARDDSEILQRAGYALGFLAGENETALHALDRAITLNPNDADAFGHRALVLAWLNRADEAITSAEQAIRLSPQHPAMFAFYIALGIAHMAAGRYEQSLAWNDRALHENAGSAALR